MRKYLVGFLVSFAASAGAMEVENPLQGNVSLDGTYVNVTGDTMTGTLTSQDSTTRGIATASSFTSTGTLNADGQATFGAAGTKSTMTTTGNISAGNNLAVAGTGSVSGGTAATPGISVSSGIVVTTAPVTVFDGSPGTPSLNFAGDKDTGLYLQAAGVMDFATAGTIRARIDSDSLGIALGSNINLGYSRAITWDAAFDTFDSNAQITVASGDNMTIQASGEVDINGAVNANVLLGRSAGAEVAVGNDTTPDAKLEVVSAGPGETFTLLVSSANGSTDHLRMRPNGHLESAGTAPTVSACGTDPSVVGSPVSGKVTIGSGGVTSCTLTFASTWVAAPACAISANTTLITAATSTSALTLTHAVDMSSAVISYICIGQDGG